MLVLLSIVKNGLVPIKCKFMTECVMGHNTLNNNEISFDFRSKVSPFMI